MKKLLTIYDTQNPDVVFQRKGYPPLDPAKQTATNIKRTAAKKKFKGENIGLKGRYKEFQLEKRMMGDRATFNFENQPGTSIINKLVCAQSDHTYT